MDGAHRILHHRTAGGKRAEIVPPHGALRLAAHGVYIQGIHHMRMRIAQNRAGMRVVENRVAIPLALRAEAGVKILRHSPGIANAHIGGQHRIERIGVFFRWNAALRVEMRHLSKGVHARVRAARARDRVRLPRKAKQRLFHHLLHGERVFLPLPAGIVRAIVFDGQLHAHQISPRTSTTHAMSAASVKNAIRSMRAYFSTFMRVRPVPPR